MSECILIYIVKIFGECKKRGEVGLECKFIRIQVGQIPTNHDSHSPQIVSNYVDLFSSVKVLMNTSLGKSKLTSFILVQKYYIESLFISTHYYLSENENINVESISSSGKKTNYGYKLSYSIMLSLKITLGVVHKLR